MNNFRIGKKNALKFKYNSFLSMLKTCVDLNTELDAELDAYMDADVHIRNHQKSSDNHTYL